MGLGAIGLPICHGLYEAGHPMVLPTYRPRKKASPLLDKMVQNGAVQANSQAELIRSSEIILISVPSSKQVEEIVLSPDGILEQGRPGTIVIDLTSADPASTRRLSALLEERGMDMLDAPVSGGVSGALNHRLSVMVGGKKSVFQRCLPIFNEIGDPAKVLYMGPSGAGHTIKLANNFLSACSTAATTEAVMVAMKAGIDPRQAVAAFAGSSGRTDASLNKYPNMVFPGKDFNFALSLMCKDVGLFMQTAKQENVPSFLSGTVYQLWKLALLENGGDGDCRAIVEMFEKWCQETVCGIEQTDSHSGK